MDVPYQFYISMRCEKLVQKFAESQKNNINILDSNCLSTLSLSALTLTQNGNWSKKINKKNRDLYTVSLDKTEITDSNL